MRVCGFQRLELPMEREQGWFGLWTAEDLRAHWMCVYITRGVVTTVTTLKMQEHIAKVKTLPVCMSMYTVLSLLLTWDCFPRLLSLKLTTICTRNAHAHILPAPASQWNATQFAAVSQLCSTRSNNSAHPFGGQRVCPLPFIDCAYIPQSDEGPLVRALYILTRLRAKPDFLRICAHGGS